MIAKLTKTEQQIVQSNNGLQRYLQLLATGRTATPHSWLFENESSEVTLNKWLHKLDSLKAGDYFDNEVFQFDTRQLAKWGPQGEVKPIKDLGDVLNQGFGDSSRPKGFSSPLWNGSIIAVIQLLHAHGIHSLRPASYTRVVDDMRARDTLESNSGWPLFTRRSKAEVKAASILDAESGKWKDFPAIALFRNYNQKTRLVWMFPMAANLVEAAFAQPLQKALMNVSDFANTWFAPWLGFDRVRALVNECMDVNQRFMYASDFSSTDAHFTKFATAEVSKVLQALFKPQYRADLHVSLMHMHTIPLVTSDTEKLMGDHGVASGSNWTNFVETIFDLIFGHYVKAVMLQQAYQGELPSVNSVLEISYAIGDDIAWCSRKYCESAAAILEQCAVDVGQIVNREKVSCDEDKVKSLQRLFQRGYKRSDGLIRSVYPTIRALNSSLHPERFHKPEKWSRDMFAVRQFMILENCVDHPLFEEFVEFVCTGNACLAAFAKKTKPELDAALRESKLLPGLNSTYNQERRDTSLASFESIKIASRLS